MVGSGVSRSVRARTWGAVVVVMALVAAACSSGRTSAPAGSAGQKSAAATKTSSRGSVPPAVAGSRLVVLHVFPGGVSLASLSCPAVGWCVAVGTSSTSQTTSSGTQQGNEGIAVTEVDGRWSTPVVLEPGSSGVDQLDAVSCPQVGWCMAVDLRGRALEYQNGRWGAAVPVDSSGGGLTAVDCLSPTACTAVGDSPFSWNGSSWSGGTQLQTNPSGGSAQSGGLAAVGCWQAGSCVTVDESGDAYVEQGGVWSPGTEIAPGDNGGSSVTTNVTKQLDSVACPGPGPTCFVVDSLGRLWTWISGTWSAPRTIDQPLAACVARAEANGGAGSCSSASLYLSCPSAAFCAAADTAGNVLLYRSGAWSAPQQVDPDGFDALSCPQPGTCFAVAGENRVVSITDGTG